MLPSCAKKTTNSTSTQATNTEQVTQRRSGDRPQENGPQGDGTRRERPQFADLLTQMDVNKDGKLEQTEVKGSMKENFSTIDKDGDGYISEAEFEAAASPKRGGRNCDCVYNSLFIRSSTAVQLF